MFQHLLGVISLVLLTINIVFWMIPILILSLFKLLLPIPALTRVINYLLNASASAWISINTLLSYFHCPIEIDWPKEADWSCNKWYLVIANHQSWVDIPVLQRIFNRKIPFLKFFLKKELIYVPLLGIAWWALDFPFMKRHSKSYLKKHPEKKGEDLKTTRKACEKFKQIPISVMNFVEGTRYTPAKAKRQDSPYHNLLKPKSGGIGTVLSILGDHMDTVVDVTIHYPGGIPSFWEFLCFKVPKIQVVVRTYPIARDLIGDMSNNETRKKVQNWLNGLWQEKDLLLTELNQRAG
jgi:1-acyl-sn-glycerol-3-phosphate acyltransferase